jgi:hypothetical protein
VTLRARWVTLRARWVTLRARWVMLRSRWVTLRARGVTLRARWMTLRARWVTLRARWVPLRALAGCRGQTIRAFDAVTSKQIKKMSGHSSVVNSCCPARRGPQLIVSGSDDGTAKVRTQARVSEWVRK